MATASVRRRYLPPGQARVLILLPPPPRPPRDALRLDVAATGIHGSLTIGPGYTAYLYAFTPTPTGGRLGGTALFSQLLGASYDGFSLAPDVTLVGGATYAMVIGGVGGSIELTRDTYPGGNAITCFSTSCSNSPLGADLDVAGFFATFGPVPATTPPEPGTWALLGVGLGAMDQGLTDFGRVSDVPPTSRRRFCTVC